MVAVFGRILEVSGWGSVIVLAVLLLRLALRKASRRAVCLLWMIAVLRLLMPFRIESSFSLQPELPETVFQPTVQVDYFDSGTAVSPVFPDKLGEAVEYPLQQPPAPKADPVAIFAGIWLAGVAVLMMHGIVSYLRLRGRVRDAVIWEEGVWISPGLDTAFVLGFFRPQIYLPVLSEEERELVLLHERCHIRRLDHWWKLAAYLAVSLHWFNPLAWVTYVLMCRDMELACDQETVKGMDNAMRRAYSAALLRCAVKRSGIAACPVAFGEISVKERIKMVLNYKKPGFWVTVVALIAAIAVGFFLLTTPKELTDLEKCEQALKNWQGMESIHLRISSVNEGDLALNSWAETEYWASGGNALERWCIDDQNSTIHWRALQDGKVYNSFTWHEDGVEVVEDWAEDVDSQQWNIPWIIDQDWTTWQFSHVRTEQTEAGMDIHLEAYLPEYGTYPMVFTFEGNELKQVQRSFTEVKVDDREKDGILAVYSVQTFILEETDRGSIEKQMKINGPVVELVQLYSELDALQAKDSVHLVIDMEIDSNYDGWDTCRQEFLKSGNIWYRNFDYKTSAGVLTTSYLYYGAKVYAQEISENPDLADRNWAQIKDQGFGELSILNRDWRQFDVLEIERQKDGSAVITLVGDLSPTEDTTYYEKTYKFYLDANGTLTGMVYDYHASKNISEWNAQGTFEVRGKDTVNILDTSNELIRERITAVKKEAIG